MSIIRLRITQFLQKYGFLTALGCLFLYLLLRNMGYYPVIFSDEETYNNYSRLLPRSEASVPSYLYFWLFGFTNACGDGFLECTRVINAILFVLAAPFIYLIGRRAMPASIAAFAAFLSVAGPASIYTWYFMPEASYYFGFAVLSWSLLRYNEAPTLRNATLAGVMLGLLSLIKVHALFLIPALSAFIVLMALVQRNGQVVARVLARALLAIIVILAVAAVVRFGLGEMLAGDAGLKLFGPLYSSQASNSGLVKATPMALLALALTSVRGHAMGLLMIFAVPFAAMLMWRPRQQASTARDHAITGLLVYTVLMLVSMVAVTVGFSASVASGPHESIGRLHMRYYDFVLPLVILFAASQIHSTPLRQPRALTIGVAVVLGVLVLYVRMNLLKDFSPAIVDGPSVHGMSLNAPTFSILTAFALITLAGWAFHPRRGARLFLFLFLPVYTLGADAALSNQQHYSIYPDQYMTAGRLVHELLTPAQTDRLTIVGSDDGGLYKARFYVGNPRATLLSTPDGQSIDAKAAATKRGWMLIVGTYTQPDNSVVIMATKDAKLIRFIRPKNVDYSVDLIGDILDDKLVQTKGVGGAEGFGRWTDGKRAEFIFAEPLPTKLTLKVAMRGYGPNVGRDVLITLGSQQAHVKLSNDRQEFVIKLDNPDNARILAFDVPQPTSPKQAGEGPDERPLGIGFHELTIHADSAPVPAQP